MFQIHIASFRHNDPNLTIEDILQNIQVVESDSGVFSLRFNTTDKYIEVDTDAFYCAQHVKGPCITLTPHIDEYDNDVFETGYFEHSNYYRLELVLDESYLDKNEFYEPVVMPLKHEYVISYIPMTSVLRGESKPATFIDSTID